MAEKCVEQIRYIAVKGLEEVARGNDLIDVIAKVSNMKLFVGNDVVVWDMGTVSMPITSVAASTCNGWLTIRNFNTRRLYENFGVSFTPKEMLVLRKLFETWKLESGQLVSDAIKGIYDQTYISFLNDEFKVIIDKLLGIVNYVQHQK